MKESAVQDHRVLTDADLGYPTEAFGRIPSFANREEEAEFWDTHDITDFIGVEFHRTEVDRGGELAERVTVRLDRSDRLELNRQARARGVGPSTLARMWLKERLRLEASQGQS